MTKRISTTRLSLTSNQKVPFVCFACRVCVRLPLPFYHEDISDERWVELQNPHCPRCKKPLAFLGRYFKVPTLTAINQWRKAELLWQNGWQADGYSSSPRSLRDALNLLPSSERRKFFAGRKFRHPKPYVSSRSGVR